MLLGFIDEIIAEHHVGLVDYRTNKLGGLPDWIVPQDEQKVICKLCESLVPLLLQIYAPIKELPRHHRTLYIFACINPNCWGNSKSWTCLKHQTPVKEEIDCGSFLSEDNWGTNADDWDIDDQGVSGQTSFSVDEVASIIERVAVIEENANEVPQYEATNVKNVIATAVIEPDENEPISLDLPLPPKYDLINMMKQKPTSSKISNGNVHFIPAFIYAADENIDKDPLLEHVQSLLSDYTRQNGNIKDLKMMNNVNVVRQQTDENYEKSLPAHGDKLFHAFASRVKMNPEQVLRYNRTRCDKNAPLFLYPESYIPRECNHCHGPVIFEMQILSTVINHLQLSSDEKTRVDCLEFGTALIYTCKSSCDKSQEECVVVQLEKI